MNILESIPNSWQAGICLSVLPIFKNFSKIPSATELCEFIKVPPSSAYLGKKVVENLLTFDNPDEGPQTKIIKLQFENEILKFERSNPSCRTIGKRNSFSLEFKGFIVQQKERFGLKWEQVSAILDIPIETLKKFSRGEFKDLDTSQALTPEIVKIINKYLRSRGKKSTKEFFKSNSDTLEDMGFTYRSLSKLLLDLGLTSATGIFKRKTVLDKLIRFQPNMIWGTDGKTIKVEINGTSYKWVWQCLIDYTTTVIVGGLVDITENTENLLTSMKAAQLKWKTTPLAIVLDNRLSENLPCIKDYLDEFGIEIIKTFPGNAKSNGITEGNFSIFEQYMGGQISIDGEDEEDLSKSIAVMLVEVFTQLRNNKSRGGRKKTPIQGLDDKEELPEEEIKRIKAKLKAIADRLRKEQKEPVPDEQKSQAIDQAMAATSPPFPSTFIKGLSAGRITADIILQATAIFKTQVTANPDKNYNHSYFGGIVNNLVESKYLRHLHSNLEGLYYENWEELKRVNREHVSRALHLDPVGECIRLTQSYLEMPIPTYGAHLLIMIKECFLLASQSKTKIALELRDAIAKRTIKLSKYNKKKRETIIRMTHEWTNQIKLYEIFDIAQSPSI